MKSRLTLILIILSIGGILLTTTSQKPTQPQTAPHQVAAEEIIKVAYCPTMQLVVHKLGLTQKVEFSLVGSSHEALQLFKLDKVDAVIIGRKARAKEIRHNSKEFQADTTAATLAANSYQMITADALNSQAIATSLPIETTSKKYPNLHFISTDEAKASQLNTADSAVWLELVLWKDFDYSQQDLAVVVNDNGQKIPSFRTPFLYYEKNKEQLMQILIKNLDSLALQE